jgi:nucleotide-binding universal stress UspA family protein
MGELTVVCIDGSERCRRAVSEGMAILAPTDALAVVTVIGSPDYSVLTGTGMAGGTMVQDDFDKMERDRAAEAQQLVVEGAEALGLADARLEVLVGDAGPAICAFAVEHDAAVLVMGSRGRGGFKRAVLGSVSDHVVRNAPCPVVVTGQLTGD